MSLERERRRAPRRARGAGVDKTTRARKQKKIFCSILENFSNSSVLSWSTLRLVGPVLSELVLRGRASVALHVVELVALLLAAVTRV